jgi:CheY-like chemotaxis protein
MGAKMAEILLVDDMEGVRKTISAMLKRGGHSVTPAANGIKAIDLLKSQRFDLVVTDILMPEGDGTEVMMFLDKMPNRPRIVAMSGGGSRLSPELALLMARVKADAILTKPFENAELMEAVGRLLG